MRSVEDGFYSFRGSLRDVTRGCGAFSILARRFGRCNNIAIWIVILHCVMCCTWRERNARTFEGCEIFFVDLKLLFLKSLFEWVTAFGLLSFVKCLRCLIAVLLVLYVGVPSIYNLCTLTTPRFLELKTPS